MKSNHHLIANGKNQKKSYMKFSISNFKKQNSELIYFETRYGSRCVLVLLRPNAFERVGHLPTQS